MYSVNPVGVVRSPLTDRRDAPRQGNEGAPDAWIEIDSAVEAGLLGIAPGDDVILLTWFDRAGRDALRLHPRGDVTLPIAGVFATRSPDRPNPIGLHRVTVLEIDGRRLKVGPLEALDGTPVIDIKPVLDDVQDA
jgi:tRNA-Thr(GGU) m(6)t(6)A37 methyltransferase TsaA